MELKKQKKIKIKKQTGMRRIRDLGQKKTETEGNNANWKLEKKLKQKKAVMQSGYPWNQSVVVIIHITVLFQ